MNFILNSVMLFVLGTVVAVLFGWLFVGAYGRKSWKKVLTGVLVFEGIVVILAVVIAYNKTVAQSKPPARVVIESTNVETIDVEENVRRWNITITFREVDGKSGTRGTAEGYLYDSSGRA